MTPELWDKIKTLFSSAQDLPAGERKGFLTGACDGDAILRSEVEKLLDSHEVDDNFLEDSAVAEAASIFDERKAAHNGSTPPISSQFDAGMVVNDRYQIIRLLGRGGMGEVYLAKDERINRNVALKALHPNLVANKESLRRFALEAQAVSALNHPNIVTIYEFDSTADGTRFFVTEYVEGQTIGQLIGSVIDIETILNILIQAASALSAAHAAGIVHRDIKPDNIMIRSDGYIKVLDFGLAKLSQHEISPSNSGSEDQTKVLERTQPGVVMGTAAYMSPEQARGRETDPRTDVWSLGVVLYELITGRKPFPGETPADIVVSVLSTEPRPISEYVDGLPSELEWAISKSLSKDVDGRYQTVKGLRADLERIQKQIEYDRTAGRTADISRISDESEENVPVDVRPTVAESPRPTDGGLGVDPDADEIGSSLSFSSFVQKAADHRLGASVIAVVLIALITSAVYFAVVPRRQTVIDSIAVLPFENIGGDPDQAYAADGISESLIDRLSQLAEVKVISRNSSFKFRGPDIDVRNAASQLGVRAVLTGSISRSGDDMVVRYDIVDTVEDRQLAGGQVRQKANELQSIQDQISIKIVEQLRLKLTGVQQERIVTPKPNNADAYRYYLSGLVEMNGPDNTNRRALEYFEKAVSLDPELAEAYVELAWIHWWRANASTDPSEVMPKAIAATKRALEIDPNLSKAHGLQAMMYEYEFNWPEAEREYLRAIELSPNLDFNRNNFSFFLSVMGRQDEALAQLEEQRLRDPINPRMAFLQKAIILVQARKFDDALAAYREAQAIEPSEAVPDFALGYAYAGKGNYRQAAEYFQKAVNDVGGPEKYSQSLVYLAATYAKIPEKQAEARAILARLDSSSAFASPALLAAVDSALGNKEKAFELLEKAYIKKDLLLRYVGVAFEYDDIRDDPRFKDLLRRTGLPDHAK